MQSLQTAREDHLSRLLRSDGPAQADPAVPELVTAGYLQRRLLPHTVPLSAEELLQLLREDQLQLPED